LTWETFDLQMKGLQATAEKLAETNGHGPFAFAGQIASATDRLRVDGKYFARGGRRVRIQGVTYGPFAANSYGEPFPEPTILEQDFIKMRELGVNAIRTYHLPPEWLLAQAQEQGIGVFVDIAWPTHLCFLDNLEAQRKARQLVREAAKRGRGHACVLAYSVGNEIPPNIVRWHGAGPVERFIAELRDVAKQADPDGLVTYSNYPSTEYLDLSFLDFATFNVYLHDPELFRRYLLRLHRLVGDKPLLLGELGMDTLEHGESKQACFLSGHIRDSMLLGLAGTFVFSWSDEWHTGGHAIEDWAFGITYADRVPKEACRALSEVFDHPAAELLDRQPRVSVVVCTYNGGSTIKQCLNSLLALDYPDYEVIVVDDGSTDDTAAVLAGFSDRVRVIRQQNQGLSAARNVGLKAATGEIVVYTDSDCFVDVDWLTLLVYQFDRTDAAAVGGPNLSPDDGRLAACVAAAPGQPIHVLESDQVAEHIPGCNMAFRREALLAINGFDPVYRKAGDDVDICWRLRQAGYWITFAPGAFVWHHRRQTPRAYLRQQAGYGEAEALLRFKHPDKFNSRGDGKWRGLLYGSRFQGVQLSDAIIYQGTFGTGLFQCIYQPGPAHWAMLPSTLEWHAGTALLALAGIYLPMAWIGAGLFLLASVLVATLRGLQAQVAPRYDGWLARGLVISLCWAGPMIRSWRRYCTRFFSYRPVPALPAGLAVPGPGLPFAGVRTASYWSNNGTGRIDLLRCVVLRLNAHRWGRTLDSGWFNWDVEIYCHPWTIVRVHTAQEDHGGGKHLVRVRYRLRPSGYLRMLCLTALAGGVAAAAFQAWPLVLAMAGTLGIGGLLWWRGTRRAAHAQALFAAAARELKMVSCP
jgi:GT2 family glycosyltransferase